MAPLPQKRYFRQRAHSNPFSDHCLNYPLNPSCMDWDKLFPDAGDKKVEFLDVGCGYGGLLGNTLLFLIQVSLSPIYDSLILGLELRTKVAAYVSDRITALRSQFPDKYNNISILRSNAMKFMPNLFHKHQVHYHHQDFVVIQNILPLPRSPF